MRDIIIRKITELKKEQNAISTMFQKFDDREDYKIVSAKIELLEDLILSDFRSYKIALLKDNKLNFDMGLLTPEEYENRIKEIKSLKGY